MRACGCDATDVMLRRHPSTHPSQPVDVSCAPSAPPADALRFRLPSRVPSASLPPDFLRLCTCRPSVQTSSERLPVRAQPGAYEGRGSFGGSEHPVDEASAHGEVRSRLQRAWLCACRFGASIHVVCAALIAIASASVVVAWCTHFVRCTVQSLRACRALHTPPLALCLTSTRAAQRAAAERAPLALRAGRVPQVEDERVLVECGLSHSIAARKLPAHSVSHAAPKPKTSGRCAALPPSRSPCRG